MLRLSRQDVTPNGAEPIHSLNSMKLHRNVQAANVELILSLFDDQTLEFRLLSFEGGCVAFNSAKL
jgi:hypothetical protein